MRVLRPSRLTSLVATPAAFLPMAAGAQEHGSGIVSTTDGVSQALVALTIVLLFVFLAREAAHRVLIAFGAAAFVWLVTYLTPYRLISFEKAWESVDVNVLLLLASMMAIVAVLKATGFFGWAVGRMMNSAGGNPSRIQTLVVWFTGGLSAMLDNVTTVIFVTPMVKGMGRKLNLNPVAILLPMVIASNVGGTATLIGDPPNIMIGSAVPLSFMAFVETLTAPVIIMLVAMQWFALRYYRADIGNARPASSYVSEAPPAPTDPLLLRWMTGICAAVVLGFVTHSATGMPAAIPAAIGAAAALIVQDRLYVRTHRPTAHERQHGILQVIEREIEWPTLSFFFFLFIVVGAAVQTGLIGTVASGLHSAIAATSRALSLSDVGTLLLAALIICWASAVLSAFIDNIPYVAVSIPIVRELIGTLPGDTVVLWWALALGACLGGNGTLIGASANVTTVGLAEKDGIRITFADFFRFGWPAMTITLVISSAFLAAYVFAGSTAARIGSWVLAVPLALVAFRTRRPASARAA
jgi:Na+/H+ antiporter NhaD/arsenite permease-like protein